MRMEKEERELALSIVSSIDRISEIACDDGMFSDITISIGKLLNPIQRKLVLSRIKRRFMLSIHLRFLLF